MTLSNKLTVLVVDDVQENVDILLDILDDLCDVSVALDGPAALEIISSAKPDLVLLDIMMPHMDGYEVCRRIKGSPRTNDIPIIFITALDSHENESKGLEMGAIDYITKPFNPSIVKARVHNHLNLCKATRLKENVEQIVRHDLKNPMTFILGVIDLMIMDDTQSEYSMSLLKQVKESAWKILNLIELSMDTFKMEHGTFQENMEPVDLLSLFKTITTEQHLPMTAKEIEIYQVLNGFSPSDSDQFEVAGIEVLCYTLFGNLIKNAIEASPLSKRITITFENDPDNEKKSIQIHNHGCVPEEIRERFFEKYATAGKRGGSGLGTYSAALITETLGGTIHMETSESAGTTIRVELPAVQVN